MVAMITASLCCVQLFVIFIVLVSADQISRELQFEPGQNINLKCRTPDNKPAAVVEWSRTDLEDEFVLLFRDGKLDPEHQHQMYENRVDLRDQQMKDGDVSLVLNNMVPDDRGIYECRVAQAETNRKKRAVLDSDPICTFRLSLAPLPGTLDGQSKNRGNKPAALNKGWNKARDDKLIIGLAVWFIIVLVAGFVALYYIRNRCYQV
ncbi:uncharacterized protein LOC111611025 [Xiphophorus maculatus]|uniref:uncharacterized protein LOC111611025 n=1 Tax=Xiphophorus maculatus TaxID=8083 RepID=UPI000C6E15FA|nr:uncharacterized protein LOC111611025 [Xiphophorus maculatus]